MAGPRDEQGTRSPSAPFGQLLKRHRIAAGLTQEALAERSGLSVDAVSALERGSRRKPQRSTLSLLAGALALSAADQDAFLAAARGASRPRVRRASTPGHPHNLPTPPTRLVGREREIEQVSALLRQPDVRLLTLTGSPGVGKTRLGLAAAWELVADFPDGVYMVPLASLADPDLVGSAIRQALGVQQAGSRPTADALAARLHAGRALLLIDNFENVLTAAPLLAELLARCPGLRILVTSRAPLRLRGERQWLVRPLALPAAEPGPLAELSRVPSVALFVQCAEASSPDFRLTRANAGAVAEICRRLEGLPLALELAAPWIRVLDPGSLLERLRDRLLLLVGGAMDLPEHQRTMRRTLQWSYERLTDGERALFRRLSAFSGGAPLKAVEKVCQAAGPLPGDVFDAVTELLDKNLVQRADAEGEPRLSMLETMREYARELLEDSGEAEATARAHADHYLAMVKGAGAVLKGPEQIAWLAHLELEHDNLRAALAWARDRGDVEFGMQLASRLWRFWQRRGHGLEGLGWLDEQLAHAEGMTKEARARALMAAGNLSRSQGDLTAAAALHEAGLQIWRELGHTEATAHTLHNLGHVAQSRGDFRAAVELLEESLVLYRSLGDDHGAAVSLYNLGCCAMELGDLQRAAELQEEAAAMRQRVGDWAGLASSLNGLGTLAVLHGDHGRAAELLGRSLVLSRSLGDEGSVASSLRTLGDVARAAGDDAAARRHYGESLAICVRLGERQATIRGLERLAAVAAARGETELAARFWGAAASADERIGALPGHDPDRERFLRSLEDRRLAAAWTAGRGQPLEDAADQALAWARAADEPAGTPEPKVVV